MLSTRTILSVVSLALVALLLLLDTERVSPGPLSLVHASDPALQGSDSCNACHGHLFKSMTSSCYECHELVEDQVHDATGFHGQLEAELAEDCASCHSEHHGHGFSLVSDRSFLRAGFLGRETYDHRGLGYELTGVHETLDCAACHEHADAAVVPLGSSRFLGLDQTCTSCHEDSHEGEYGTDCASCHGQTQAFEEVGGWAHETFAPLVGSHAETDCESCHEPDTEHAVEALALRHVAGDTSVPERDCAACHTSFHAEGFLSEMADRFGRFDDARTCQHCHLPEHTAFPGENALMTPAFHAASGFRLESPHQEVECAGCHTGFGERAALEEPAARQAAFGRAYPGREEDTCSACHVDAHQGQFDDSPFFLDADCIGCHERTHFAPTAFELEHHERSAFPLAGSHAAAECETCHLLPDGQPRVTEDGFVPRLFRGTTVTCTGCHESPHRANFIDGVAARTAVDSEACTICHDAAHETFLGDNAPMDPALHAASGFPLDEPHHEVACADCHEGFGERVAPPDHEGWLAEFLEVYPGRAALDCNACHQDPHVEQFRTGDAFVIEDCLSCHEPHGFRPPQFGFTHHERTAFPLTGSHEAVGCNECHLVPEDRPALTADGLLTRVFSGTDQRCETCHEDVHSGRFDRQGLPRAVEGREGCARCHDTQSFELRRFELFDHGLWAGYELTGAHAEAACKGCHTIERSLDPPRITFGTLPGTACQDCHEDSHVGQFAVDGVTDCERCHQTSHGFDDLLFDHQTDSRFALDEVHVELECEACHRPVLVAGVEAVRYKPLGVDCSDCHDPSAVQLLGGDDR